MEKEYLLSLIKNGESTHSIAKIVKKGQTTVRYWLKKYDIKTYKTKSYKKCIICGDSGKKICGTCRVKIQRFRYKLSLIKYLGGKCIKCGIDDTCLLDFHHINSKEKLFSLSQGVKSWKRMKKEAEKCVLLCSNCHRKEHNKNYWNDIYEYSKNYNGENKEMKELLGSLA